MSQTRVITNQERRYDFLYDRLYQAPGERDHARASYAAMANAQQIVPRSNFDTMFSELRNYPRLQYTMNQRDDVPRFVSRHWHGIKQNNDPSVCVGGQDRFRFFRRPIIPYATQLPPDVVLAAADPQNLVSFITEESTLPPTRTVACQTDYRDGETQTDPYTPDYIVRPGEVPEVLTLATLNYGRGLPGGLHAVEMLERARHRRAMEAELPPLSDFSQSEKRQKMMDAIEREEWRVREQQIEELQQLRLGVLIKLLKKREETHQEMSNQRLDRLWNRKQKEKEVKFRNLRLKHVKALRQLIKRLKNVENRLERRDIIREYGNPASQSWAPLTRIGQFLDKSDRDPLSNSRYLHTYEGLMELEKSLPEFLFNPKKSVAQKSKLTKAGFKKREFREQDKLDKLYENIKESIATKNQPEKPLRFLEKIEKPVPRPPTPTIEEPNSEEEDVDRCIILIQQMIRGRAVQAMMHEGMVKRKELIEELRSTHSLLKHEQDVNNGEKSETLNIQRQRFLLEHREDKIDEELGRLEGESMSEVFEFLSKELIRLQEERRTHAIFMKAERERRIREAEESGLRQLEERRRREQDEIFKQVIKVNQDTIDQYLNEVIQETMDITAVEMASNQVNQLAQLVNDKAYQDEANKSLLEQEEIVGDLIHNFLIPEVHKQTLQEDLMKKQHKYLNTAHREIVNATEDVGEKLDSTISQGKVQEETQTERAMEEEDVELKDEEEEIPEEKKEVDKLDNTIKQSEEKMDIEVEKDIEEQEDAELTGSGKEMEKDIISEERKEDFEDTRESKKEEEDESEDKEEQEIIKDVDNVGTEEQEEKTNNDDTNASEIEEEEFENSSLFD